MSLIKMRFNLLLVLSSLMILREATTLATAANTDIFRVKQKVVIDVVNTLPNSMTIHCKSGDNDLNEHVIDPQKDYSFDFNVNFFGTTLFFCGVTSQGKQVVFDVYKASRDQNRCPSFCKWHVTADGVEGYNLNNNRDILIPWK